LQLAIWGGHGDIIQLYRDYRSEDCDFKVPAVDFNRLRNLIRQFAELTKSFSSSDIVVPASFRAGAALCQYFGLMQMRKGRLVSGSAWLDVALMIEPGNAYIRKPEDITCSTKACDRCGIDPIRGPYFTCTLCLAPCYDLCRPCFETRSEGEHRHERYLKVPSAVYPLPTLDGHLDNLRLAIEQVSTTLHQK